MSPSASSRVLRMPFARTSRAAITAVLAAAASAAGPVGTVTVVEYYNAALDHYFITPLPTEIDALDSGRISGWGRTGLVFDGYATAAEAHGAPVSPVCRFYIPPVHGDSHFLSASPALIGP